MDSGRMLEASFSRIRLICLAALVSCAMCLVTWQPAYAQETETGQVDAPVVEGADNQGEGSPERNSAPSADVEKSADLVQIVEGDNPVQDDSVDSKPVLDVPETPDVPVIADGEAGEQVPAAASGDVPAAGEAEAAPVVTAAKTATTGSAKGSVTTTQAEKAAAGVQYCAHVQKLGWKQGWKKDGATAGTTGRGLRLESLKLKLVKGGYTGSIEYRVHVQNIGWTKWRRDGQMAGTTGRSLRLEAVQIRLKGDVSKVYEVVYRTHVQNIGWQNWVSAGATAGTTGRSLRIEALRIRLLERPSAPEAVRTVDDGLYTMRMTAQRNLAIAPASTSSASGVNVRAAGFARWRLENKWRIVWKGNGYELANANSGKVLAAVGGGKNLVANVRQEARTNALSQRWAIVANADGSFSIRSMSRGAALAIDGSLKSGANAMLWSPSGSKSQKVALAKTEPLYEGTYQLFSKVAPNRKCIDVYAGSVANKARLKAGGANDGPNQHFIIAKSGNAYTIRAVSSGKYVTVSGSAIVQLSKNGAAAQLWTASIAGGGGLVLTCEASGKALTAKGKKKASALALTQATRTNAAGQRWYPYARPLVSDGLYEFRTAPKSNVIMDVNGGSFASGANATVHTRNGGNNQKFSIVAVKNGYYRIGMALSGTAVTVKGASKANKANVRMETWKRSAAQLWKPVVTDGGLAFINKKSGRALSFSSAKTGANVRQMTRSSARTQKWSVVKTQLNPNDLLSYRMAVDAVSGGGGVKLSNAVAGYSISKARWNQLIAALNRCWNRGIDIGFIMMDCNTGMSVSLNPDSRFYGASTIKALYVTYLFEEYLEKGRLSWGSIDSLATLTITISDNDAYQSLRNRYGSEAGFGAWLNRVGVGYIGTWGTYSPRTLAKAWTHMLDYSASGGRYVSTWKSIFDHSYYSSIREGLGGYRTTYSKPGWMFGGSYGTILNDAAVVDDRHGRRYLLAMMSDAYPDSGLSVLGGVAAALDAIHMEMPTSR